MREYHRRIVSYLRETGARHVKITPGKTHPRARFQWRGREHAFTIANSPGDMQHALRNSVAELRRYLNKYPIQEN
jgi:hypothetical protein